MAQVIASTWGACSTRACRWSASIVEYLKVRELLLVLDNCEHLLDDAGEFADAVVQRCPKVTVLATSREALEVAGRARGARALAGDAGAVRERRAI